MKSKFTQAVHIASKDFRYLVREIGLLWVLIIIYAWMGIHSPDPWWAEIVAIGAMVFLVSRAVHAETILGQTQFWVTRPYEWGSLLTSKVIFVTLAVNLPFFIAQLWIVYSLDLPLKHSLVGLLWMHFLMIACGSLSIIAIAAMTNGIAPFLFAIFVLLGVGVGIHETMIPPSLPAERGPLVSFEWIWNTISLLLLFITTFSILYIQYKYRDTRLSYIVSITGTILSILVYLYMPWQLPAVLQVKLSSGEFQDVRLSIILDPSLKRFYMIGKLGGIQMSLPIKIEHIPEDLDIWIDAASIIITTPNDSKWSSGLYGLPTVGKIFNQRGNAGYTLNFAVPRSFYLNCRDQKVVVRASLYMTLLKKMQVKKVLLENLPITVADGLQCGVNSLHQLSCRSAFRWPGEAIYATFNNNDTVAFDESVSYSPFPSGLNSELIETRDVTAPGSASAVTLTIKRPITHIKRQLEFRDVLPQREMLP